MVLFYELKININRTVPVLGSFEAELHIRIILPDPDPIFFAGSGSELFCRIRINNLYQESKIKKCHHTVIENPKR